MTDFAAPGADGVLPDGFDEFHRGLIYTVQPRMLAGLRLGEQYRILVTVRRKVAAAEGVESYAPFYVRAQALLQARVVELQGAHEMPLHTWIASHGWFRMPIPGAALAGAAIALGVTCADGGAELPAGHGAPLPHDLRAPFVEHLGAVDRREPMQWDEFYNDFDMGSHDAPIVTVSYGEYVESPVAIEFEPIVRRAEGRARMHYESLERDERSGPFRIVRREWTCLETGKRSQAWLAHVNVYVAAGANGRAG